MGKTGFQAPCRKGVSELKKKKEKNVFHPGNGYVSMRNLEQGGDGAQTLHCYITQM